MKRIAAVLLLLATFLLPLPASAVVLHRDGPGCIDLVNVEDPTSGVIAQLSPKPDTTKPGTTVAETTGMSGMVWHTFDTGCKFTPRYGETAVREAANGTFGATKFVAALGVAPMVWAEDHDWIAQLEPWLASSTRTLRDHVFLTVGVICIALVGLNIAARSHRGDVAGTMQQLMWVACVVLAVMTISGYPVQSVKFYSNALSGATTVASRALGDDKPVSQQMHNLIVDQIIYPAWAEAQFGSDHSATAAHFGRKVLTSQSFTYTEMKELHGLRDEALYKWSRENPRECSGSEYIRERDRKACLERTAPLATYDAYNNRRKELIADKDKAMLALAEDVKKSDPDSYDFLAGHDSSWAGFKTSLWAMLQILCILPFTFVAGSLIDTAILLGLVAVVLMPVIGAVALLPSTRRIVVAVCQRVGLLALAGPIFSVFVVVHASLIALIMSMDLAAFARVLFAALVSVVMWCMAAPVRTVTALATGKARGRTPVEEALTKLQWIEQSRRDEVHRAQKPEKASTTRVVREEDSGPRRTETRTPLVQDEQATTARTVAEHGPVKRRTIFGRNGNATVVQEEATPASRSKQRTAAAPQRREQRTTVDEATAATDNPCPSVRRRPAATRYYDPKTRTIVTPKTHNRAEADAAQPVSAGAA